MSNLVNRLAALQADDLQPAPPSDVVAADLARGRVARRRRRRRSFIAGAAGVGLVAASSAVYLASSTHQTGTLAVRPSAVVAAPSLTGNQPVITPIALVAYHGDQLPGYSVERIPAGYVLQGISASVLDIAKAGDHTPLDSFAGKLVVMLNDYPGPPDGLAVTVKGQPGRIRTEDGVMTLTYREGSHNVAVQCWDNIKLTRAQLVSFAEGVTVLKQAETGHG